MESTNFSRGHALRISIEITMLVLLLAGVGAGEIINSSTVNDTIKIASFNLQVFGTTKADKPEVMDVLSKIIRNYDIIAVQEIRDASQTALPSLLYSVNSVGNFQFSYIVSERLGRTTSKEQYAYFFNTQTIGLIGNPYTFTDSEDLFEREPFVANFKVKNGNFNFVSITIHVEPENATQEIKYLPLVVDDAKRRYQGEDDFIIMGDLNADCDYFDENSQPTLKNSDYFWIINNSVDTTTKSTDCTYDRIIITTSAITDYTGNSGAFRFDTAYNLSYNSTTAVSDHYPVYAEFWNNMDTPTATATPTPIPTATQTPTPTSTQVPTPIATPTPTPIPTATPMPTPTPTVTPSPTPIATATLTPSPTPTPTGYDTNGNGIIDKNEAVQAVIDYFNGTITKEEAINVVLAYFSG